MEFQNEITVLSGCLTGHVGRISFRVQEDYFPNRIFKEIYKKLVEFSKEAGVPMSKDALKEYAKKNFTAHDLIEAEPIIESLNPGTDIALLHFRIDELTKAYKLRQFKGLADEILSDHSKDIDSLEEKIREMVSSVKKSSSEILEEDFTSKESTKRFIEFIEEMKNPKTQGILCGVKEIDKETGGGRAKKTWLYCAYTSHGKSTMLSNHAHHAAVEQGMNVVFCSAEMGLEDMRMIFNSLHAYKKMNVRNLDTREIEEGKMTPETEAALRKAAEDLNSNKKYGKILYRQIPTGVNIQDIHMMCEQINKEIPVHAIFVDYFTKLSPIRVMGKDNEEQSKTISYAQQMSLSFNHGAGVFVCGAHQMNREGFAKARVRGGVFLPNELSMTSEAEKAPDVIITIFKASAIDRREDEEQSGFATATDSEVIMSIIKNRGGKAWPVVKEFGAESNLKVRSIRTCADAMGDGTLPLDGKINLGSFDLGDEDEKTE